MKIVIDISENDYWSACCNHPEVFVGDYTRAIKNGTPLPKGHGRLIDVNSIYQIVRPIEPSDAEWGMTAETAKLIIYDVFNTAPTIIEADIGEEE